jgi:hypothetical protein
MAPMSGRERPSGHGGHARPRRPRGAMSGHERTSATMMEGRGKAAPGKPLETALRACWPEKESRKGKPPGPSSAAGIACSKPAADKGRKGGGIAAKGGGPKGASQENPEALLARRAGAKEAGQENPAALFGKSAWSGIIIRAARPKAAKRKSWQGQKRRQAFARPRSPAAKPLGPGEIGLGFRPPAWKRLAPSSPKARRAQAPGLGALEGSERN